MSAPSDYCKAYLVGNLRGYPNWEEEQGEPLAADACVFVHDDLTVTRGIYKGEQVVFDRVTDEWRAFCVSTLAFVVPTFD